MRERLEKELELLRARYPDLEYRSEGRWILIPSYPMPEGWNRTKTSVAFQVLIGFPGTPPYGFYVQAGILYEGKKPANYTEPAPNRPPFPGSWGVFSWAHTEDWRATSDPCTGSNLLNWTLGFSHRFREGA